MRSKKNDFYLSILQLLKLGHNPSFISKKLKISKQKLNYYIRQLKKEGLIKKIGYGVWEVKNNTLNTLTQKPKKIRGHAFIWTIKLNKKYNWKRLKLQHKLIRNCIPRVIINGRKIWLGKKTITIYEINSFYGENSIQARKYAVISLLELLETIEKKLNINLKPYYFKPAREHYGMIKNELARQYNRKGEKLHIKDGQDEWLWIDDSESLGELETNNIIISKQVQDWWNNHKKYKFQVTPQFLMERIYEVTENQMMFAKNLKSHIKAIKALTKAVERKNIKENIKEDQTILDGYR